MEDVCVMFDFVEQLEAVLCSERLFQAMEDYRAKRFSTDDIVRSPFDATEWKEDPFFKLHTDAYTIAFYYDDVTVTNPIGQYKRKVNCIDCVPSANASE